MILPLTYRAPGNSVTLNYCKCSSTAAELQIQLVRASLLQQLCLYGCAQGMQGVLQPVVMLPAERQLPLGKGCSCQCNFTPLLATALKNACTTVQKPKAGLPVDHVCCNEE